MGVFFVMIIYRFFF